MPHNLFGNLDALADALLSQEDFEDRVLNPLKGVDIPKAFVVREYSTNFRYVLVYHRPLKIEKWVSVAEIKKEGFAEAHYDASPHFIPTSRKD